jgi:hypothetical protein
MAIMQDRRALLSRVAGVVIVLLIFGFMFRGLYLEW